MRVLHGHLSLRHLVVFREVAHSGAVNAAARSLYLSQPAATQAIAAVERYFGVRLFDRTSAGMTPTVVGRRCLERIERALAELGTAMGKLLPASVGRTERALNLGQLEALIALVKHGSFRAAAKALGIAVPTLHQAARALEQVSGTVLLERTSCGLSLNRDGERFARHAGRALAELQQARDEFRAIHCDGRGRTVIGAMPLSLSGLVPSAVLQFMARYPLHTIELLNGPYETLLRALRDGSADVLIGALRQPAPANDVVEEPLFDDPLTLVMRAGHPLTRCAAPDASQLRQYPWIAPRLGTPLRQHFEALFAGLGVPCPTGTIECNSQVAASAILQSSDHIMLLSERQVMADVAAGVLAILPHPLGRVVRAIGLTLRVGWRPTEPQQVVLDLLRHAGQYSPLESVGLPKRRTLRRASDALTAAAGA
ncbi:MAG TPA: LysR family transcriptional regulator [Steroidobacteraceae bacterium]|jgi:DNA-binding transcriptional LysR family regulator|nr:LysR family transcriptional regulator [Steroidobacteraceae bacterium]